MKQSLIILSSITTLTLASNTSLNIINNNTAINNKLNSNTKDIETSPLFNNTFGYLSQDNWITNQSTVNHKYYSYNTNHAKTSDGKNIILSDGKTYAQNTFIVDNNGNLTINSALNLSDNDKNTLNNIGSEMNSDRKVTTIKDSSNPYSKSQYSESYFNGDNITWKYLQMGSLEKHIDISSQQSAIKVENNNNLSEAWGLYYIAKACRTPRGITEAVAKNLGKYFISQSSLNNKIKDNLIYKIINVIATNDYVYNLFNNGPVMNKDNSTNYIFDSSNNLIEVYYSIWTNNNIENNANY